MSQDETEGTLLPEVGPNTREGLGETGKIVAVPRPARNLVRVGRRAMDEWIISTRTRAQKATTGAAIVGGLAVGSAVLFGIMETTLGAVASWFVYRRLRRAGPRLESTQRHWTPQSR
jgi:hypothetical protein